MKISKKHLIIPIFYLVSLLLIILCIFLTIYSVNKYFNQYETLNYSKNVILEEYYPVNGNENKLDEYEVIKPFTSSKVNVLKSFYDFEADSNQQENSIILFENSYIQNSGIDYVSTDSFEIISIFNGKVIDISEDETMGKIVKIEHDSGLIAIYECMGTINVNVGDVINKGESIGLSGVSNIYNDSNYYLHFEVFYSGKTIDPESIYNKNINELY